MMVAWILYGGVGWSIRVKDGGDLWLIRFWRGDIVRGSLMR